MARLTQSLALAAVLAAAIAAGVALHREGRADAAGQQRIEIPASLAQMQQAFNAVAESATRSIVQITTKGGGVTFDPRVVPTNVGSGVILTAEGHIVTNYHVVEGGTRLLVRFADGVEVEAKAVGLDPESDLALLKIDADGRALRPLALADSDRVRVGDWVLAIGNPYGYNHTVTSGIVSAKHRTTESGKPYQDFIQTDAAINPGNSGGALVNLAGEVIGINAEIVSRGRGNEGIGFAISSNLVKWVTDRLKEEGRVRRGYLGLRPLDLNQPLVDYLSNDGIRTVEDLLGEVGLDKARGVWVEVVEAGTPAARAGLKRRDVIVEFDGRKVESRPQFLFLVAETKPGRTVPVRFLRDRKERQVEVELAERPPLSR